MPVPLLPYCLALAAFLLPCATPSRSSGCSYNPHPVLAVALFRTLRLSAAATPIPFFRLRFATLSAGCRCAFARLALVRFLGDHGAVAPRPGLGRIVSGSLQDRVVLCIQLLARLAPGREVGKPAAGGWPLAPGKAGMLGLLALVRRRPLRAAGFALAIRLRL